MLPNQMCAMMQLFRIERKRSSDQSDVKENFPDFRRTDVVDQLSLDQLARKILFSCDCQSISFYENQKGTFRDLAEREDFGISSPPHHLTKTKQPKQWYAKFFTGSRHEKTFTEDMIIRLSKRFPRFKHFTLKTFKTSIPYLKFLTTEQKLP